MPQDIICQIILRRLFSNAHFDPRENRSAYMGDNIFDSVMPSRTAFRTNPQFSYIQTDIVIDHDQFCLRINFIIIQDTADTLSAQIHIRLWLCKNHFLPCDHSLPDQSPVLLYIYIYIISRSQSVYYIKSDIMPCPFILPGRIPQSCNNKHLHDSFLLLKTLLFILLHPQIFVTYKSLFHVIQ